MTWRALLGLALLTVAEGADHPVATEVEFQKAVTAAKPGDTITLSPGEWKDAELLLDTQGTAEAPITMRAAEPGKTVLTGKSRLRFGGNHLVVTGLFFKGAYHKDDLIQFRKDSKAPSSHCRLTECAVVDCNAPKAVETRWIGLYGQHNRIDHCSIQGKTSRGTTLVVWLDGQIAEHRIDHNYFGPRPPLKVNGGETIRVGDSKSSMQVCRTIVEANCFEQCDGEAEIISNKSCENIYRGNTFRRCSGALTLRHGNDCLVEGNFFFGENSKSAGGVRIIGERHRVTGNYFQDLGGLETRAALCLVNGLKDSPLNGYFQVRDALITRNTWVNCRQPIYIGQTDEDRGNDLAPQGVVFTGNEILGKTAAVTIATPGEIRWEENVVNSEAALPTAIPGIRVGNLIIETEPKFRDGQGPLQPSQTGPDWR